MKFFFQSPAQGNLRHLRNFGARECACHGCLFVLRLPERAGKILKMIGCIFPVWDFCVSPGGFTANPPTPSAFARYPPAGNTPAGIRTPARNRRGLAAYPLPREAGGFDRIFSGRVGGRPGTPPGDHRASGPGRRSLGAWVTLYHHPRQREIPESRRKPDPRNRPSFHFSPP